MTRTDLHRCYSPISFTVIRTWLQSLLVWSPGQRDIIKTVALVL
ncbi:hypothetical protein, partial [Escherichia coli]